MSSHRRFISFRRRPVLCPRCGSLERHRVMWFYLHERTNIFRDNLKVLHFAPDALERKLRASLNLDYITADLYQPAMVKVDITAIPFADNTFDAILCSHVLEHISDDRKAMSELYRVLKPSGWVLILVPLPSDLESAKTIEDPSITDSRERQRVFGQSDHVRIYGWDIVTRLEQAGFIVHEHDYAREVDPSLQARYGLPSEMLMFYCVHP